MAGGIKNLSDKIRVVLLLGMSTWLYFYLSLDKKSTSPEKDLELKPECYGERLNEVIIVP